MWAGAERNLLREAPQGHRRKPSATLEGGHARDTRFGSLEVLSRPPPLFSHPSTLEERPRFQKKYRSSCSAF
jgi:hypothetical protein